MTTWFARIRAWRRSHRYRRILESLDVDGRSGLILDLGGGAARFFSRLYPDASRVILLDLESTLVRRATREIPGLHGVAADGARLPFRDRSIAVTICNSVIEHVADPDGLAREIERVSHAYFVQTPNGMFPVETHSLIPIPMYQWVPWRFLRRGVCRLFGANFDYIESVRYVDRRRLARMFPRATLVGERLLGVTKSFYLIARSP